MSFKFNVFTGNFDIVDSGSSTADYVAPLNPVGTGATLTVRASGETLIYESLELTGELYIAGRLIILPAS